MNALTQSDTIVHDFALVLELTNSKHRQGDRRIVLQRRPFLRIEVFESCAVKGGPADVHYHARTEYHPIAMDTFWRVLERHWITPVRGWRNEIVPHQWHLSRTGFELVEHFLKGSR